MKQIFVIAIMILCSYHMVAQESDIQKETERIKKTIQTAYVEGLQNEGDTIKINSGFHPSFEMLMPMKDGLLKRYAINEWKEKIKSDVKEGKLPRKSNSRISVKFLNVDVSGTVAVAKFEFYVGDKLTFIDFLSLIKFGDDWKIVSKMYYKL